jgi:hypothetical protein
MQACIAGGYFLDRLAAATDLIDRSMLVARIWTPRTRAFPVWVFHVSATRHIFRISKHRHRWSSARPLPQRSTGQHQQIVQHRPQQTAKPQHPTFFFRGPREQWGEDPGKFCGISFLRNFPPSLESGRVVVVVVVVEIQIQATQVLCEAVHAGYCVAGPPQHLRDSRRRTSALRF